MRNNPQTRNNYFSNYTYKKCIKSWKNFIYEAKHFDEVGREISLAFSRILGNSG